MCDFDYIPLDQEVIAQAVEAAQKCRNEARAVLTEALKDKNAGGNFDIIVFHEVHKNFENFKRMVKALDEVKLCWYEIDGDIYVNRHEYYDIIYNRSGN